MRRTFEGVGPTWEGWVFTLEPETNESGSEGYRRVHISPRRGAFTDIKSSCEHNEITRPGYTERMRRLVESPAPDWVELPWLENWLAAGIIRESKP